MAAFQEYLVNDAPWEIYKYDTFLDVQKYGAENAFLAFFGFEDP